jgi:hypothetical protein
MAQETQPVAEEAKPSEGRTVGSREGLAMGIISLGVLSMVLPSVVDQLPAAQGDGGPAAVLYGMMVLIGAFVVLAGIVSLFVKD